MATLGLWIAYAGVLIVMIGGATWPHPMWAVIGAGLAVIGLGIVVKRKAGAPPIDAHEGATRGRAARTGTLREAVAETTKQIKDLSAAAPKMHLEEIKQKVEDIIYIGPDRVGEAQLAITARVGFPAYAEVMGPLATAERLLYRTWSAASDGHRPEALRSLQEAIPWSEEAQSAADRAFAKL